MGDRFISGDSNRTVQGVCACGSKGVQNLAAFCGCRFRRRVAEAEDFCITIKRVKSPDRAGSPDRRIGLRGDMLRIVFDRGRGSWHWGTY